MTRVSFLSSQCYILKQHSSLHFKTTFLNNIVSGNLLSKLSRQIKSVKKTCVNFLRPKIVIYDKKQDRKTITFARFAVKLEPVELKQLKQYKKVMVNI